MKFLKGLASLALGTLVLANPTIATAATWAYSNLNASDTVVAYSADYPTQTSAAAAYWNSLAGTTVVAVTNNQADATVTIEKRRTSAETASAPEQEPSETTSTEVTETTTSQIAGSATVSRDATSVKPTSATVSVESLPEPTKAGNQGGRLQQEVKVVIHKVSDALATK